MGELADAALDTCRGFYPLLWRSFVDSGWSLLSEMWLLRGERKCCLEGLEMGGCRAGGVCAWPGLGRNLLPDRILVGTCRMSCASFSSLSQTWGCPSITLWWGL